MWNEEARRECGRTGGKEGRAIRGRGWIPKRGSKKGVREDGRKRGEGDKGER
jgi:hypothetical protein